MEAVKKTPTIEGGPKELVWTASFNTDFQKLTEAEQLAIAEILAAIASGKPLPEEAYRRGHLTSDDTLLLREGIMHLHFSATDDNQLLFVEQYGTYVVVIAISDHTEFKTKLKGLNVRRRVGRQSYAARQTLEYQRRQREKTAQAEDDDTPKS
jgi:hypothetical protein